MAFHHYMQEEKAMVSIDFLTGVGVLLMAFLFASYTISSVMTPYSGYSKELYPAADRAATLLVRDAGYWTNGNDYGTEWNIVWDENQSYVRKIGLIKPDGNNTIDSRKLNVFMQSHSGIDDFYWWEYPTSSTEPAEKENVSRALGLSRNNFYFQIRPVNESRFNVSDADAAALDAVGEQTDVVAVTRLAMTVRTSFGDFTGTDLSGHTSPTKILFVIEPDDFDLISNGIRLSIRDWIFVGSNVSDFQWIKIGNKINTNYELTDNNRLSDGDFSIVKNGINITGPGGFSFNNTDTITFFVPLETLESAIPDVYTSGKPIYLQLNVNSVVEVTDEGMTEFSNTKQSIIYLVKMTLWTW
ncbi:MAG: hypothetical protein M8353_00585 [ANME-2 cluster archaeon]|nr:hypothetical protein [ANME-2 cluster archaeon]